MDKKKAGRGGAACERVRSWWQLAVAMEGDEQEASATSTKKNAVSRVYFSVFPSFGSFVIMQYRK